MATLLRQNSELRADGIWNWTIPAWVTKLPDGRAINVCPSAGACKDLCYARNGTYRFPNVIAAHQRNLMMTLDNLPDWEQQMLDELQHRRFRPKGEPRFLADRDMLVTDSWAVEWMDAGGIAVRIHDAGDFYSDDYLAAWLRIAEATPDVLFYAYTKEVKRCRLLVPPEMSNFRVIYSMGGTQDRDLDVDVDRHADVFPDLRTLAEAGYMDQEENDLYCVLLNTTRVGVAANNIKHFKKRMGGDTFGELEAKEPRNHKAEVSNG